MSRQRKLNKRMRDLFPQQDSSSCRVCNEEVVDARWNYCSERCRDIAKAVQGMFTWTTVREQVLERDDHTCQLCGDSDGVDTFEVDHITRIADGGHPFDESNLRTLCEDCHAEKTAAENSGRQRDAQALTLEDYLDA